MKKVAFYSLLLVAGLVGSQFLPPDAEALRFAIRLATMFCLAFLMIHVGYEFEIDKKNLRSYGWDYVVAATAAAFPWILCAVYFVYVLTPPDQWSSLQTWKESLLTSRFAAPTSAGVLFSMLAAAGLSASWMFRKARVLAIFDDLDTILLMIPLKMLMVGLRWQLGVIIVFMVILLVLAWRYIHALRLPSSWGWVMAYAAGIVALSEIIYQSSKVLDDVVPIHLEVLLPAFVLGCMLARPAGADPHQDDAREGHQEGPESATEQRVSTIVASAFMLLVGLSMPPVSGVLEASGMSWGAVAVHVLIITVLANLGKMYPALCYRREAHWRERLAVSVGMFPRGEVGAGVLVVSLGYGIGGPMVAIAVLSLALNLLMTGLYIIAVKRLLQSAAPVQGAMGALDSPQMNRALAQ